MKKLIEIIIKKYIMILNMKNYIKNKIRKLKT